MNEYPSNNKLHLYHLCSSCQDVMYGPQYRASQTVRTMAVLGSLLDMVIGRQVRHGENMYLPRFTIQLLLAVLIGCVFVTNAQADHISGPAYSVPQVRTGGLTKAIDFGDLNHDGHIDAVTANTTDNTLSVLLGNGEGGFTLDGTIPAGARPTALVMRDFSGNGSLDIAVIDRDENTVQIFLGDGVGNFSASTSVEVARTPYRLVASDFNGDGRDDLAVLNPFDGVSIVINTAGTMGRIDLTVDSLLPFPGSYPRLPAIAAGDSDGDGDIDLVVSGEMIWMFHNDGAGIFTEGTPIMSGRQPIDLTFADVDGDGDNDVATVDNERSISIAQNLGGGSFSAATPHAIDSGKFVSVDAADLDGDGRAEIVALSGSLRSTPPGSITILDRDETGTISIKQYTTASKVQQVRVIGADGDGRPDIAILAGCDQYGCPGGEGSLNVLLNRGLGGFGNYSVTHSGDEPVATAAADFNNDGHMDIAVSNRGSDTIAILGNDGLGRFSVVGTLSVEQFTEAVVAADFDNDGDNDLVFSEGVIGVGFARNRGDGTFSTSVIDYVGRNPILAAADMDGDSDVDVVVSAHFGISKLKVLLNNGAGDFTGLPIVSGLNGGGSSSGYPIIITDIDGDSNMDVVVGQREWIDPTYQMNVLTYRNNGSGSLATPVVLHLGEGLSPVGLAAGDVDNDGDDDIAVGDATNGVIRILTNTDGVLTPTISLAVGPDLRDVKLADLDDDGRLDVVAAVRAAEYSDDGPTTTPSESISVWYGEAAGGFSTPQFYMSGLKPTALSIAPFTETGKLDIAVADEMNGNIWVIKQSEPRLRIDFDLDGLENFIELDLGLDIYDPDSDGDGLLDGIDPSVIAGLIVDIPRSSFRNLGHKKSLIAKLKSVEKKAHKGRIHQAIDGMQRLGGFYDGCLSTKEADFNDRVLDCNAQFQIRNVQDIVVTNLKSML